MPNSFGSEQEWRKLLSDLMAANIGLFRKVANGIVRDHAEADDACQQAMVKAMERPDAVRSGESLRSWFIKIVINEGLLVLRKRKADGRMLARRAENQRATSDSGSDWALCEAVWEAVDKLPEPTRTVVVMRMLDGMSGGEVKEAMGRSDAYVSRELRHGMELLRDVLKDWDNR